MEQETKTDNRRNVNRRTDERRSSATKMFEDKTFVFREHETAQEAYIIKSGKIRIVKTVTEAGVGREITLKILEQGTMFGEMALIDDKPRMASAQAYEGQVTVYVISQEQFKAMLKETNPFVMKLLGILTNMVRENSDAHVENKP